jgi:flagellar biosynthesis regulator FlaF
MTDGAPLPSRGRAALSDLLAHLARHAASAPGRPEPVEAAATTRAVAGTRPASQAAAPARTVPAEIDALPYFRRTWSRLSADQRLAQSQAALPGNVGPLNSQHLVHRSLMLMREVAPEYLEHFLAQVDALHALESTNELLARRR